MNYYILSEDIYSPDAMEISYMPDDVTRRAIACEEYQNISKEYEEVEIISGMADISTYKYPIISEKLKSIFDLYEFGGVFYKMLVMKEQNGKEYVYYLTLPKKLDCLNYEQSKLEKVEDLRINNGFYVKEKPVGKMKIFRISGITNRLLIIDRDIKEKLEESGLKGIKIVPTEEYNGA
jgi:hypothetical protein